MKVLHLTWGRLEAYGGIETHIEHLSRGLEQCGIQTEAMMLPSMNPGHLPRPNERPRLPLLGFSETLEQIIKEHGVDIVHTHNIHRVHARGIPQAVGRAVARTSRKHVTTIHDVGDRPRSEPLLRSISEVLGGARCIVTSEHNRSAFSAVYQVAPSALIPPALDFEAFPLAGEPEALTIAYPGRLTAGKGALDAVMLVGQVAASHGRLTLLLSDPGRNCFGETAEYLRVLQDAAASFSQLKIEFLPTRSQSLQLYSRAALTLCMPLMEEGFGLVPLESLAVGRPVVATPTGGMSWIADIPGVITVQDRDAVGLAEAIVDVLENGEAWRARARQSRGLLRERFDARTIAAKHIGVYQSN
jgi:glycosyltransferase involved in cell wall biosynthesis